MPSFCIKSSLVATPISEHVSFSDEGPLLETLEVFEISHASYQPFNCIPILKCGHPCLKLGRRRRSSVFQATALNLSILPITLE